MQIDFESLTSFIAPEGCFEWASQLFSVESAYDQQLMEVNHRFSETVLARIRNQEVVAHGLCVPTLVRLYASLLDQIAPPSTPAEVMYSTFIMGRMLDRADSAAGRSPLHTQLNAPWTTHPN